MFTFPVLRLSVEAVMGNRLAEEPMEIPSVEEVEVILHEEEAEEVELQLAEGGDFLLAEGEESQLAAEDEVQEEEVVVAASIKKLKS